MILEKIKRVATMQLNRREKKMGEKIFSLLMTPILVFNLCSINFLVWGVKTAEAADGSGTMTVDDDNVSAGAAAQIFKFTFDPSEDMDGGAVKIEIPAPWDAPTTLVEDEGSLNASGEIYVEGKNGADLEVSGELDVDISGREITVNIEGMSANQYFIVKYYSEIPTVIGDYEFTTESKLAGGLFQNLGSTRQASVEVEPGTVASYQISTIADQTVGVDFNLTVTAKDAYGNVTTGDADVDIEVKTGTGSVVGDTSADTSTDGADTITLKYTQAENGVVLKANDGTATGDSNAFDVESILAPTFTSPSSWTNDSTPTIDWGSVSGTGIEYSLDLVAAGSCDAGTDFSSPLLSKVHADFGGDTRYTLASAEALLDETDYCVRVEAEDDYTNSMIGYRAFHLATAKPATPTATIELEGDAASYGHPANTINIYNNEDVTVRVDHATGLDEGTAYVKIEDGLGNKAEGSATISDSAASETSVSGINASALQQGSSLSLYARVTDAAGNSSDWSGSAGITKDTNAPARPTTVSFLDDPVKADNDDAVNIQVVGESGTTAYYTIVSSAGGAAADATGSFNMTGGTTNSADKDLTGLNDGTLTATVFLTDSAWNHGNTRTGTVTKDATAPEVALTYNPDRKVKDADDLQVTATFTEDMQSAPTIAIEYTDGACGDVSAVAMTTTGDAKIWTYPVDVPTCDGVETTATVTISGMDLVGNTNNAATNNTFAVDNIKPTVSGLVTEDVAGAGTVHVNLTFVENMDQTVDPTVTIETAGPVQTLTVTGAYTDATHWSGTATVDSGSTNGVATLKVSGANDVAGNAMDDNNAVDTFTIDTNGPTFTVVNGTDVGPVTDDTINVTVSDATGSVISQFYGFSSDATCDGTDTTDTAFTSGVDFSIADNHTDYLCAKATDNAGNVSYQQVGRLNTDNAAPVISDVVPANDSRIDNVTASSDISYTLSENVASGTVVFTQTGGTADGASPHTCNLVGTALNQGSHTLNISDTTNGCFAEQTLVDGAVYTITFDATDAATNAAAQVTRTNILIDTTPPTIDSVNSGVANESYSVGDVIDIDVTFSENVTSDGDVTVTLETGETDRTCTFQVDNSNTGTCNYFVQAGDTTSDLDVLSIVGTINDQAGNAMLNFSPTTNLAAVKDIVIDTTAPSVGSIISTTGDGFYNETDPINVTVNFSEDVTLAGGNLNVTLDTGDVIVITPFGPASSAAGIYTVGAGDTSTDLDSTNIALAVGATLKDAAGNDVIVVLPATTIADDSVIVIDTTAPTTTVNIANDKYNAVSWDDVNTIVGESADTNTVASVEVSINDGTNHYWDGTDWSSAVEVWNPVTTGTTSWKYTLDDASLADGTTYTVKARATDNAGNTTSAGFGSDSFMYDTSAPGVVAQLTPADNTRTYLTTPEFTWTDLASDETNYILEVNGNDDDWNSLVYTQTVAGDVNSITIPGDSSLTSGTYKWRVYAQDAAGNKDAGAATIRTLIVDNTAPEVSAVTLSDPSPTKAGTLTITVDFNEDMDQTVGPVIMFGTEVPYDQHTVTLNNAWASATRYQADIVIPADGTFDGNNTIKIVGAKDVAGNTMNDNTSTQFVIDSIAPDADLTYAPDRVVANADTLRITASFGENMTAAPTIAINYADVACVDLGVTGMTMGDDATEWVYDLDVPDCAVVTTGTVTIAGQDLAGNAVTATNNNVFNLDNVAPAITFTQDVDAGPVKSDSIAITVTDSNPNTATYAYGFSADDTCDGTDVYGNTFTSGDVFVINIEADNGKYVCAKAVDVAGNTSYQVSANTLNIDVTLPTLNPVSIASDNANTTLAKTGDTVTVTFTSSETLGAMPTATIAGQSTVVANTGGNNYTATRTFTGVETEGNVTFTIDFADVAGNAGTQVASVTDVSSVTFDKTSPTADITSPATGSYTGGSIVISGTSDDGVGTGVASVEVKIQRASDSWYWNDGGVGSWQDGEVWNAATGTDPWAFTFDANLEDTNYAVTARATDTTGNVQSTDLDTIDVMGDVSAPTSAITAPANGARLNALAAITGTATDTRSGVDLVNVYIQKDSDGSFWNGSAWVGGAFPLAATYDSVAETWSYAGVPAWESEETYNIASIAIDEVNNDQAAPGATATFTFDNQVPTFSNIVVVPTIGKNGTLITLTFTASETLLPDPTVTLGGAAMTKDAQSGNDYTYVRTLNASETEGTAAISISGTDLANNVGTNDSTTISTDFQTPASVSITDPTDGQYKKGAITIAASASDNPGGLGIQKVEFLRGGVVMGEDTTAPYTYDLNTTSIADGAYVLTATAYDEAGNTLTSGEVDITVDNTVPTTAELTGLTADQVYAGTISLGANAADAIGVARVDFYDGDPGAGGTKLGEDTSAAYGYDWVTTALNNGAHTLYARVIDNADNILDSAGVSIVVDNSAPNAPTYNSLEGSSVYHRVNPVLDIDFADNYKIKTIEYKVNTGGTYRVIADDVNAATYTADWSMDNADWTAMSEVGSNYLYFRITDYADNQYETPDDVAGFTIKKDVTAPNAPTMNTAEDQWFKTNPTLDIDFSDARALQTVEYQFDGLGGVWTHLATINSGTTYDINWSMDSALWDALGEGTHYIYFKVTDDAGNEYITGDDAAAFTFKKDVAAPSVIANLTASPAAGSWSNDDTVDFDWDDSIDTGSGMSGYSYIVDHVADTTPDDAIDNATSSYSTTLPTGQWYIHVKALDSLGNATAVAHYGPVMIDAADPSVDHTSIAEVEAGVDPDVDVEVDDPDSGIDSVKVFYKHHGDDSYTSQNMTDEGSGHYSYGIPDEENSEYVIHYYIEVTDNAGNTTRKPSDGDYDIDVVPAGVDHFTFIYPTTGTRYAGTSFNVVLEARDTYNNVATSFNGSGDKVNFTTDEAVSVFVDVADRGSAENQTNGFDNGVWAGRISFGSGGGVTPSGNDIVLTATDTDDSGRTGSITMTTSGIDFGTVGAVEGDGTVSGDGGELLGQNPGEVQGVQDNAPTLTEDSAQNETDLAASPWYKQYVSHAVGAIVVLLGFSWWWFRRKSMGSGDGTGVTGLMFATLKTAATKMRMFLW